MWVIISRDSFEEMSLRNLRISLKGMKRNFKKRGGHEKRKESNRDRHISKYIIFNSKYFSQQLFDS